MSDMDVRTAGGEPDDGKFLSEEYGVGGPPAAPEDAQPPVRTVGAVALEIRTLQRQAQGIILSYAIEIGRRLEEAKAMLPHGEWGAWLKNELDYSQSTAQNFMKVFREYGDSQQSLFGGAPKSQTFGNLTYSKALRLLAIPDEEERARFVAENDVEHMTTRELNEALKARDAALEEAAAAVEDAKDIRREVHRLQEQLTDQARTYEAKLTSAGVEADQLREKLRGSDLEVVEAKRKAREAQEALDKQRDKAQRLQDALSEANASAQAAEEEHTRLARELEELRERSNEVDVSILPDPAAIETARQAAIAEMTEKVDKAEADMKKAEEKRKAAVDALTVAQNELAELKAKGPEIRELTQEEKDALTAEAVNQAKAEGAEQIRSLKKKLAAADPNVAEFNVRWTAWREDYQKMMEVLERIKQADAERAAKLRQAVKAALEQMEE